MGFNRILDSNVFVKLQNKPFDFENYQLDPNVQFLLRNESFLTEFVKTERNLCHVLFTWLKYRYLGHVFLAEWKFYIKVAGDCITWFLSLVLFRIAILIMQLHNCITWFPSLFLFRVYFFNIKFTFTFAPCCFLFFC